MIEKNVVFHIGSFKELKEFSKIIQRSKKKRINFLKKNKLN